MQDLVLSIGVFCCFLIIGYNFFKAQKQKYLGNIKEAKRYFKRTVVLFVLTGIVWPIIISIIGIITERKTDRRNDTSFKEEIEYCSLPYYYSTLFSPGDINSFSSIDSFRRNIVLQGTSYDVFEKKYISKKAIDTVIVGINNEDDKHFVTIEINQREIEFLIRRYNNIRFLGINSSGCYIFYLTAVENEKVILSLKYISGKVQIIEYDTF